MKYSKQKKIKCYNGPKMKWLNFIHKIQSGIEYLNTILEIIKNHLNNETLI